MGYSSGMLNKMVFVYNKKDPDKLKFGEKISYELTTCIHADVTWSKGVKAMREGALDAYDTVLIRMRWTNHVNRDSLLECDDVVYQIQSMHADRHDNTIQITATEMVGQVPIQKQTPPDPSSSDI